MPEDVRDFLDTQAAKESQFDNATHLGVDRSQLRQGIVKRHKVLVAMLGLVKDLIQREFATIAAPLGGAPAAGMIDQQAPHSALHQARKEWHTV